MKILLIFLVIGSFACKKDPTFEVVEEFDKNKGNDGGNFIPPPPPPEVETNTGLL